jgi:hypothetical protein
MERLDKRLFKKNRPVIRKMGFIDEGNTEDSAFLWDLYCKGIMKDVPSDMNMEEFIELLDIIRDRTDEIYIIEDLIGGVYWPIAFVLARSNGWLLEPHVYYSDLATARHKMRSYVAFLKHTKYRKDLGACLVRVDKETTPLANKMEGIGLLEFVGKIWGGMPSGNEYLYSVRCQRRE